jgi:hypothetical protein
MKILRIPTTAHDSFEFEISEDKQEVDISLYRDKKDFESNGWIRKKYIRTLIFKLFEVYTDSEREELLKQLKGKE